MPRARIWGWAAAAGILALAGCGRRSESPAEPPTASAAVRTQDLAGREVTLDAPAARIVTIPVPTASTFISVDGGTDRLVGVNPGSIPTFAAGFVGLLFPNGASLNHDITAPGGGTFTPNVEAIAALHPDIVIQSGDGGADLVRPLENAGLKTALYSWGTEEKAKRLNDLAGAIVGKPEKARLLNAWRDRTAADVSARVPARQPKPKALALGRMGGGLRVWAAGTIADGAIRLTGGDNVAASLKGISQVNQEQVAAWDPEIIFLFDAGGADLRLVYDDPILKRTKAAQAKRVYLCPTGASRWGAAGEDDPLYWMWMADLMRPGAPAFDLRAEIKRWTGEVYGRPLGDDGIDRILRLDVNRGARGYDRLARR